jgi:hypothetical protein
MQQISMDVFRTSTDASHTRAVGKIKRDRGTVVVQHNKCRFCCGLI